MLKLSTDTLKINLLVPGYVPSLKTVQLILVANLKVLCLAEGIYGMSRLPWKKTMVYNGQKGICCVTLCVRCVLITHPGGVTSVHVIAGFCRQFCAIKINFRLKWILSTGGL